MSKSNPQSYDNHAQFVPLYHFVLAPLSLIVFIASIVHLFVEHFSFGSFLIFGLSLCAVLLAAIVRQFATRLQDRLILQEETQRHLRLTGQLLDARLSLRWVIALRFAEDDSFPELCRKAAETGMEPNQIKKSIGRWRADHYRV